MSQPNEIALSLTSENVGAYCQELMRQSPNAGHALAALTGMQTFMAFMVPSGSHATSAYRAIMGVIAQHAASARKQLLEESTDALVRALRAR